ncbi:MAG: tRNA (adenosine(37)-N6)-threonylcarbamoyltransferase complex dimerization subunit type 1 TsaB [Betaproteobacteria bacterium]|nr:MAG: tRNA (adenosine(37)-N6)-threonylcarbamoyltransferase complex dimerization subunit type 1 TsaB [Betaproteobacteria bacterium]TMH84054.1 MAG: tRNA (adenosine(37)-N6)-threonylcarbamoyltransferase complex dimerization subunit type 1 TsaB [Betaproteobacteria bacterium]
MNLLAIDTSTDFCSVAASRGEAVFSRHERAGQRQAEMILGMVDEVLAEARIELAQIHGIAYGQGPGSFTGLRIAAGVTQGLALARGIGVIGVGSLLALSEEAVSDAAGGRVIACLDAHRDEVYHAAYRRAGTAWEEVSPPGLYRPEAVPVAPGEDWTGCGDGFAAYRERLAARLGQCVAAIRPEAAPSARAVLKLAMPRFAAGEAKDAATAVPVYLRDKVALKTSER